MPTMTLKEWAAEYRANAEWEQRERLERLPHESPADSVRDYFALSQMLVKLSGEEVETGDLWELRLRHYRTLIEKWQRLARHFQYVD